MFWIINAVLIVIALAFLLPSLLRNKKPLQDNRREQNIFIANEQLQELETRFEQGEIGSSDYQSTRDELEQALFSDVSDSDDDQTDITANSSTGKPWLSSAFIALLIPAIAIPVYLAVGNSVFTTQLDSKQALAQASDSDVPKKADGSPDIDAMLATLQQKMDANPNNVEGWIMLGRSYMTLKRFPDAVKSYEQAYKLEPKSINIMMSLADSLAMKNNGEIAGRPSELIEKALELDPNNLTALWLGGMAARQQKQYQTAIERWTKVLPLISDANEKKEVNSLIDEAKKLLTPDQLSAMPVAEVATTSNKEIIVKVSISDEIRKTVKPSDTVFVYAKAMNGPAMPLAAAKITVKDLPAEIALNDDMAMVPNMKISSFEKVIVGARVSKSGQATAQNGDLFAEKSSIQAGDEVSLIIDSLIKK